MVEATPRQGRYRELDSLRGLAALSVFFSHIIGFLAISDWSHQELRNTQGSSVRLLALAKFTPLHFAWGGHEAVIFFFILSGFVLSLPWIRNSPPSVAGFLIKRICRIYIPYVFVVLIGMFLKTCLYGGEVPGMSTFFHATWKGELSLPIVLNFVGFIGYFETHIVNPSVWSLVHEMRISLLWPLLIIPLRAASWKTCLVYSALASVAGVTCIAVFRPAYDTNPFLTLHYIGFFIVGYVASEHMSRIRSRVKLFSRARRWAILIAGLLLYTYTWWLLPGVRAIHISYVNDWFIAVGAVLIIIGSLSSASLSRVLTTSAVSQLGKMSYSLYLWHLIILTAFVYALHNVFPMWVIFSISMVAVLGISKIYFQAVEKPAIRLGSYLVVLLETKRKPIPARGDCRTVTSLTRRAG